MHYEPSADGIMWEVTLTDISYPPQEKHKCVEIGWITEIDDFTNYNSLHNGHGVRVAWLHNEAQRYGMRVPKYGANSGEYKGIILEWEIFAWAGSVKWIKHIRVPTK